MTRLPLRKSYVRSLVENVAQCARGQIFLSNLHYGLTQALPHIELASFKSLWLDFSSRMPAGVTDDELLFSLFDNFYAPIHLGMRFRRTLSTSRNNSSTIYSTTTPYDLVENPQKAVLNKLKVYPALSRFGWDPKDWPEAHCLKVAEFLEQTTYYSNNIYAHRFGIFWATPSPDYFLANADTLRDAQGLVDIDQGAPLIQLAFDCSATIPIECSNPTVIEATYHRRFKAKPVDISREATAVDLEHLRVDRRLNDGANEMTLSAIPMTRLISARYVGHTSDYADISRGPPTPESRDDDDLVFASMLCDTRLPSMIDDLKSLLEQ